MSKSKPPRPMRHGVYRSKRRAPGARGSGVTIWPNSILNRQALVGETSADENGIPHLRVRYDPRGQGGAYLKAWGSKSREVG